MNARTIRPLACAIFALLMVTSPHQCFSAEQYVIEVSTGTSAAAGAHNAPATGTSSTERSRAIALGTEASQCADSGRRSSGLAEASILSRRVDKNSSSVRAVIAADASGGRSCFGFSGNDTVGQASAAATAKFTITFDADARAQPYELIVASPGSVEGVTTLVDVRDDKSESLMPNARDGRVPLVGGPGKVYTVMAQVGTALSDKGDCCGARVKADALLAMRLQRAPLMESLGMHFPRIWGGHDAKDGQFKQVGALMQEGRPHCTGTLIGADLVLTAAHCVYERDPALLSFVLGKNAWNPEAAIPVGSYRFPNGEQGFKFDQKSLIHDLAVVRLQTSVSVPGLGLLHSGLPSLDELKEQNKSLTFVGYGYRLVDESPADPGIKRFVEMPIDRLDDATFRNKVPGMNTCNGDSGGPAMFVRELDGKPQWVVAGITSGGDLECIQYGVNTRVDRYREWILLP